MTATIATRVRDRAAASPEVIALREKDLGIWQQVSWAGYWRTAELVGHALLALGIEPGDRVAVHSDNRREWLYADVGTVAVGAATVGLYPTNPVAEVAYLLQHSGARVLIAEDQEQVDKALAAGDLPALERIVYVEPRGIRNRYDDPRLLAWPDFLALGKDHQERHPDAVAQRMARCQPNDVVTLIYTSGTTGPPKGAMLTAANVEFAIQELIERGGFASPPPSARDSVLSYLPLCHVAERIFSTWFGAGAGVCVHFAESIETVAGNLREVQPTILFGVPRIWEKIAAGVQIRIDSADPIKRRIGGFWLRRADWIGGVLAANAGRHTAASRIVYGIGWLFCYRALLDRVGLREVRYAASGAAPIAPEVLRFFMGLGVPMHEVYGMTENTAVATANRPGRVKVGTVGEAHPSVEVRIDELTGEIQTRHLGTFAGYWRDPAATKAVLAADGWLRTGDVGEWVDGTHLRITDRMKDIIITAGGKNIAPSELENALKASPYIKEALVIGDRRRFLAALIGIEPDTVGHWAQTRRLSYTTYADLAAKPEVVALVQSVVDDVNVRFATVEQVRSFRLLPKLLDHEDGELTATQKLKRSAVLSSFDGLVEAMYAKESR
ncbi:AMP-binding protein [Kribbella sandramycini]|uniref:Acyl-CoA synthetase n=1 Tax=Kribbella sandramycini TaxID=60450 RepID=A0A7Y4KU96_9ACTN|nr:AMP-binding protein [Kribbella sandramycini]MBB6568611.1 long-chain acyl-CoA synthetase [Kribbella sandramycini]NOL38804.1 AMP-binding protein [Kribbella sandramycini]